MPFFDAPQRRIYYELHGHGPVVLFLHGAGSNAATWWQQLPTFAREYTCLTMDLRCFGRSLAPLAELTLPHLVDDALQLLDHEGVASAAVIGQSLGGMVGLRLALRHPERVACFVACDSSLAIDHPALVASVERRFAVAPAVSIEQRSLGAWLQAQHPERAALYAQLNHFNPSSHSISPDDWRRALLGLNRPASLTPTAALRGIGCATLFLVGADDPIVPPGVMRELAAVVPGSEFAVIERAGHSAYFECPEEFNHKVIGFIRRRARP